MNTNDTITIDGQDFIITHVCDFIAEFGKPLNGSIAALELRKPNGQRMYTAAVAINGDVHGLYRIKARKG